MTESHPHKQCCFSFCWDEHSWFSDPLVNMNSRWLYILLSCWKEPCYTFCTSLDLDKQTSNVDMSTFLFCVQKGTLPCFLGNILECNGKTHLSAVISQITLALAPAPACSSRCIFSHSLTLLFRVSCQPLLCQLGCCMLRAISQDICGCRPLGTMQVWQKLTVVLKVLHDPEYWQDILLNSHNMELTLLVVPSKWLSLHQYQRWYSFLLVVVWFVDLLIPDSWALHNGCWH